MKAVRETMCRLCVSGDKDYIGVVVINTENTSNHHSFKHIYTLQEAGLPGAERVKEVERFCETDKVKEEFQKTFGGHSSCNWEEAFWLVGTIFNNFDKKFGEKTLFTLTDTDQPFDSGDATKSRRIQQKWKDLTDNDIRVQLLPLSADFDGEKFWNQCAENQVSFSKESADQLLEELLLNIRRKEYKKRATANIPFCLGGDVEFSVGIFTTIAPARVPSAVHLEREKNEEVATKTSYFNEETGEKLLPSDMTKFQTYGGKRIALDFDEVEQLRRLQPAGMTLLGFKPISSLKPEYHYRTSQFIYPDEKSVKGSTRVFRALLDRCLKIQVTPICRIVPRRNMPPRLVALLPQKGEEETPPGFHIIYLPYAEDFRDLSTFFEVERPAANKDQVRKAKAVVHRLMLKDFRPHYISNPVIAKHYSAVEAMALERETLTEIEDRSKPRIKFINKGKDALRDFREAVFPPDYNPKRKATGGAAAGGQAKKAKTDPGAVDLETEARAGNLGRLTVRDLKESCTGLGFKPKSTKKADIIEEINRHFGITQ